ncbi:MAG: helix-hairpin-helix domain-containing protein [Lentimonas sp.]
MRLLLSTILLCWFTASLYAADKEVGVWQVLDNCRLVQSDDNDGDSFLVQHGSETDVFRLYYVDTAETSATYMDRVRDQARYFSITTEEVLTSGELAAKLSKLFLQGTFTIYTKWEDARGSGKKRYYALVKNEGHYLSMELVNNGLARIYGMPTRQAWPSGFTPRTYLSRLKNTERQAQRTSTGIWAVGGNSKQMAGLDELRENIESGLESTTTQIAVPKSSRGSSKLGMLNVNTASQAELETLPGIGPAYATAIIQDRPIESVESLVNIPGISANKLAVFRALIIVAEPPPPLNTVEFYMADLPSFINTDITLSIASVSDSKIEGPESFCSVTLHTAFEGEVGGDITAFIPDEFYDSFTKYYREPGRELKGLLYDRDGETVLVYRRQ